MLVKLVTFPPADPSEGACFAMNQAIWKRIAPLEKTFYVDYKKFLLPAPMSRRGSMMEKEC